MSASSTKRKPAQRVALSAVLFPCQTVAETDLDGLEAWYSVSPQGTVESSKGTFLMDEDAARAVIANFKARGTDMVVDYEHQTLAQEFSSPDGTAPASGWITKLKWDADRGLMAFIKWTARAARMISEGEYRYLSPVLVVEKAGEHRVTSLMHIGLTNAPAIHNMEPLMRIAAKLLTGANPMPKRTTTKVQANQEGDTEGDTGDLADVAAANPTEDLIAKLRSLLDVGDEASMDELLAAAIKALTAETSSEGTGDEISANKLTAATAELTSFKERLTKAETNASAAIDTLKAFQADAKVAAGVAAGKLTAALEPIALKMATDTPKMFDEWIANQPVVVPQGTDAAGKPLADAVTMDRKSVAMKACTQFDAEPALAKLTSRHAFAAQALRDEGLTVIKDEDELTKLVA